jgi:hypothetical protein
MFLLGVASQVASFTFALDWLNADRLFSLFRSSAGATMFTFTLVFARSTAEAMLLVSVHEESAAFTFTVLVRSLGRNILDRLLAFLTMSITLVFTMATTEAMLSLGVSQEITAFSRAVIFLYLLAAIPVLSFSLVFAGSTAESVSLLGVSQE